MGSPLNLTKYKRQLAYRIYVLTPPSERRLIRVGDYYIYSKFLHQYFYRHGLLIGWCPRQRKYIGEEDIYIRRTPSFDSASCRYCNRYLHRRYRRLNRERLFPHAGKQIMNYIGKHGPECRSVDDVIELVEALRGLGRKYKEPRRWFNVAHCVRKDFDNVSPTTRLSFLKGLMHLAAIVDLYNMECDEVFTMNDDKVEQYHRDGKLIPKLREMVSDGTLDPDLLADLI